MGHENTANIDTTGRLLAKLLRGLLASESFESLADLTDALKAKCARLRIRWTPDDINEAYRLVDSNLPLPVLPTPKPQPPVEDIQPLTREEAADFFRRLKVACARQQAPVLRDVATMQPVRPLTAHELWQQAHRDDQRKAYRIVQQQILDSAQRAAELEAIVEEQEHKP